MTELPARHDLSYIIPDESGNDVTVICDACGITRRFPASGTLHNERLDDLSAADIERIARQA